MRYGLFPGQDNRNSLFTLAKFQTVALALQGEYQALVSLPSAASPSAFERRRPISVPEPLSSYLEHNALGRLPLFLLGCAKEAHSCKTKSSSST